MDIQEKRVHSFMDVAQQTGTILTQKLKTHNNNPYQNQNNFLS